MDTIIDYIQLQYYIENVSKNIHPETLCILKNNIILTDDILSQILILLNDKIDLYRIFGVKISTRETVTNPKLLTWIKKLFNDKVFEIVTPFYLKIAITDYHLPIIISSKNVEHITNISYEELQLLKSSSFMENITSIHIEDLAKQLHQNYRISVDAIRYLIYNLKLIASKFIIKNMVLPTTNQLFLHAKSEINKSIKRYLEKGIINLVFPIDLGLSKIEDNIKLATFLEYISAEILENGGNQKDDTFVLNKKSIKNFFITDQDFVEFMKWIKSK